MNNCRKYKMDTPRGKQAHIASGRVDPLYSPVRGGTMVMLTKQAVLAQRDEIVALARANGAADIQLFGSVARDEADETSDVDFFVTPAPETPPFFPGGLIA